jgi:hypothetical protein
MASILAVRVVLIMSDENDGLIRYSVGLGGFNYNKNISSMDPSCMIEDSYNFNLFPTYIQTRGGSSVTISLPEISPITSLYVAKLDTGEDVFLSTTLNGNIYRDNVLLKSMGILIKYATYISWNGNIIINVSSGIPQVWDRISETTTDYPSQFLNPDWELSNEYPNIMISYGKGNSLRAWTIGVGTNSNILYYSGINTGTSEVPDFKSYGAAGQFFISTKSNEPLVGMVVFGDRLIMFSDSQSFVIDDTSSTTSSWGYAKAQWSAGALSHQTIVPIENDILIMTKDGTIYSLTTVISYGDYKISSISEGAGIENYIDERFNASVKNNMHAAYDLTLRAIKFFGASSSSSHNNTALSYAIDKGPLNGWSIHNNQLYDSGYDACSSVVWFKDNANHVILTGDYKGRIWELERSILFDESAPVPFKITTPWISGGEFRTTKKFKRGFFEISADELVSVKIILNIREKDPAYKTIYFPTTSDIFDVSQWDIAYFGGAVARQIIRYNIQRIGVDIQQIFIFNPPDKESSLFDRAIWDTSIFPPDQILSSKFNILFNVLDVTPIAARLSI